MRVASFKKPLWGAIIIESLVVLASFCAIVFRGGHSGMMVFLSLNAPSSILAVSVGENIRTFFSSAFIPGILTVILSIGLQLFLLSLILCSFFALVKRMKVLNKKR